MDLFQRGGAFVFEHRITPAPHVTHWVLVRGFYERDSSERGVQGRGVVVDVTEGRQDDHAEGGLLFTTSADDAEVGALDRATGHAIASRRALDDMDLATASRLRAAADALLIEIARHIAGTLVPVLPSHTQH